MMMNYFNNALDRVRWQLQFQSQIGYYILHIQKIFIKI